MKKLVRMLIVLGLTGCIPVTKNDGSLCIEPLIAVVSSGCHDDNRPDIERYYKEGVSNKQKIQDFKNCGAVPDKEGNYIKSLVKKAEQEGVKYDYFYVKKVYNCMINKGYTVKKPNPTPTL